MLYKESINIDNADGIANFISSLSTGTVARGFPSPALTAPSITSLSFYFQIITACTNSVSKEPVPFMIFFAEFLCCGEIRNSVKEHKPLWPERLYNVTMQKRADQKTAALFIYNSVISAFLVSQPVLFAPSPTSPLSNHKKTRE